jgi:hypothetical protein
MGFKKSYQIIKYKFRNKSKSKIRKIHREIIRCNKQKNPHHIYLSNNFLFSKIQNLNLKDLEALDNIYLRWTRKERRVLETLIYQYINEIINLRTWLSILYKHDFSSRSENIKTLKVYHFILKNEHSDSDFWSQGSGDDDLVYKHLEDALNQVDWLALESDLKNWTMNQLEIFTVCIIRGIGNFDSGNYSNSTISNRFDLLPSLLIISKQKGRDSNDIFIPLWDNLEFINQGPPKQKKTIYAVANSYGYSKEDLNRTENDADHFVKEIRNALLVAKDENEK